jgi:hypothetical protein
MFWRATSRCRSDFGESHESSGGGRYRVGLGEIEVDAIELVPFSAIS